jgi:hypothetical protein
MKKIAFVFIAALAVLSFTGCKKKDAMKEAMGKMEGFKTAMCACKDKACAEKVDKDMKDYGEKMKGKGDKDAKMSPDDEKKMMEAVTAYAKCQQTAMGTGGDMAAPPAGGDKPADMKPADPAAPPAGGDKPADMKAGDKPADPPPAGDMKKEEPKK